MISILGDLDTSVTESARAPALHLLVKCFQKIKGGVRATLASLRSGQLNAAVQTLGSLDSPLSRI
jgi:hypothetical protein